jgi:hypothetical protein
MEGFSMSEVRTSLPSSREGSTTDLTFEDRGATWLLHSNTDAGVEWIKQYIPANAPTFGKAIVIGHRYALGVVKLAINDGLVVDIDGKVAKRVVEHRWMQ